MGSGMGERQHRQNRVTPFGTFEAVPERGMFMGNRGNLRRPDGTQKLWHARGWVCCATSFRGRRLDLDAPNRYTALFFMDEAVALAAGHRPCGECRNADYRAFKTAWRRAFAIADPARPTAGDMDAALHAARISRGRQVTWRAAAGDLPTGTFVARDDEPGRALLVQDGAFHPWSPSGYGAPLAACARREVCVLTPRPTVEVLRAGYAPQIAGVPRARDQMPPAPAAS